MSHVCVSAWTCNEGSESWLMVQDGEGLRAAPHEEQEGRVEEHMMNRLEEREREWL